MDEGVIIFSFCKRKKKHIFIAIISAFIIVIVFFLIYFLSLFRITKINISSHIKSPTSICVDNCKIEYSTMMPEGYWDISGWLFNKGEDIKTVQIYVILQDQTNLEYYKVCDSQSVSRKDVTTYFHDGHKYDQSGFYAAVDNRWLLKGKKYRVGILSIINKNMYFIETDKIIEKVD